MPKLNFGRLRVLFVDDEGHTRLLLREMLRGTELSVTEYAHSAQAAFEVIKAGAPDVVFTDWQMPGASGIDLIRMIREDPDSPDPLLPVILLTASGDAAHVINARNAGAAGYVVKPIRLGAILGQVEQVVTRQRPFIASSSYKGPDWRRPGTSGGGESLDQLPPDATLLAPDGLLMAKVRSDPVAIRAAVARRAEAIAIVRQVCLKAAAAAA
jgi:CheY-like chemotaxis protein